MATSTPISTESQLGYLNFPSIWDEQSEGGVQTFFGVGDMVAAFQNVFATAFTAVPEIHRNRGIVTDVASGCCSNMLCGYPTTVIEGEEEDSFVIGRVRSESRSSASTAPSQRPLGFAADCDVLQDSDGRKVVIVPKGSHVHSSGSHIKLQGNKATTGYHSNKRGHSISTTLSDERHRNHMNIKAFQNKATSDAPTGRERSSGTQE